MCLHQKATSGFADLSKWPICLCAALTKPTKSGLHSLGHVFARLIGLVTWSISASWPATYPSTSHVPRPATVLVVTMAVTVAATAASASASSSGSRSGAGSGNATSGGATSSAGGNSRGGASSAAGAARTAAITVQQLNYTIDENTATGSVVGRLAEDMYPRPLAEARFSMPENAFFQVSLSGVFTVAGPIDRDGNRQLCVQPGYPAVCQWNGLIMSSTGQYIPVEVAVHDVNDNPPSWPIDDVTLDVPENSPASYTAELPLATDADFGINSVKAYRLLDSPATADLFTVTYSQAPTKLHESRNLAATMATSPLPRLHILRSLDRESAAWHNLTLLAFDGSPPFHTGSLHIHVRVTDENDNSPEFSSPVYTARLEEATSVGSLVPLSASPRTGDGTKDGLGFSNRWFSTGGQVNVVGGRGGLHAVDRDDGPNGNVRYSYALSTPIGIQQLFRLDETTGLLRVARELTYGAGANAWTFDVIAEDRGRPPRSSSAKVTIELVDSNNHAPAVALRVLPAGRLPANMSTSALETLGVNDVMGSPDDCVFIMENRPPGNEALAQLTVKDADTGNGGQFDCSLVQPIQTNGLTKFSNSSLTSFIPAQPTYGQKSSSPFSIVSGTSMVRGFGLIELWRLPGLKVYNLMATRSFDREAEVVSKVTVWCMDQGSPRLKSSFHIFVLIGDENDNAPYFQQPRYHLKVEEGNLPGTIIGHVSATDRDAGANSRLIYTIEWSEGDYVQPVIGNGSEVKATLTEENLGQYAELFSIDTHGALTANHPLDRELRPEGYHFKVFVSDSGSPPLNASTTVAVHLLDINDCPPEFEMTSYNFTIIEDFGRNFSGPRIVGRVLATDNDLGINGTVNYRILSINHPFEVGDSK